jgi:nitrite reductase/ring-hydroxylating ferredoxin subunit
VNGLLSKRRPRPFAATEQEAAMAGTAIALAAARVGADQPDEAFITGLHRRIAVEAARQEANARHAGRFAPGRRRVLAATAFTATGAAIGFGVERLTSSGDDTPPPEAVITPRFGSWQTVAMDDQLPEGAVLSFDLGAVTGFVRRADGRVQAISGICTHQGCRLDLAPSRDKLSCPCHGATFALSGQTLAHPFRVNAKLPALPRLPVRVQNGEVQVYGPSQQAGPETASDANA